MPLTITDWENKLLTWTKPASDTEDEQCLRSVSMIRNAIAADAVLSKMNIEVFAQGSYANDTNVRRFSDVDVCVLNKKAFIGDFPDGKTYADFGYETIDYPFSIYKDQLGIALKNYFGNDYVTRANKTFYIKPNT